MANNHLRKTGILKFMGQKLQIRFADEHDAEAIASIGIKAWQISFRGQLPDDYLDGLSAILEKRIEQRRNEILIKKPAWAYWVALQNKTVVGYCHAGSCRDVDCDKSTGEIYAIYVDPNSQGFGIGSLLLTTTLDWLRSKGMTQAILWTLITNHKTRQWYEFKGWETDGTKKSEPRRGFNLEEIRYKINLN